MTAILFLSIFIGVMGFFCGRCFKGLNPFFMIFGLIIFSSVGLVLMEDQKEAYFIPFALGFVFYYGNPFLWLKDGIADAKMSFQLAKAKSANQAQFESDYQNAEDHIRSQAENLNKQKAQAEAEIKKAAEELRRQQEAFKRQKANANNNQNESPSDKGLDPTNFSDACQILGVHAGSSLAEFKKAYRHLSSMFHPDKFAHFEGVLKSQAVENSKLINAAWVTIKRKLK